MKPIPTLNDNVPFKVGMTVYFVVGDNIEKIDTNGYCIEEVEYIDHTIYCLCPIGSKCGNDLKRFASTPQGAVNAAVRDLEEQKAWIEKKIERMKGLLS